MALVASALIALSRLGARLFWPTSAPTQVPRAASMQSRTMRAASAGQNRSARPAGATLFLKIARHPQPESLGVFLRLAAPATRLAAVQHGDDIDQLSAAEPAPQQRRMASEIVCLAQENLPFNDGAHSFSYSSHIVWAGTPGGKMGRNHRASPRAGTPPHPARRSQSGTGRKPLRGSRAIFAGSKGRRKPSVALARWAQREHLAAHSHIQCAFSDVSPPAFNFAKCSAIRRADGCCSQSISSHGFAMKRSMLLRDSS